MTRSALPGFAIAIAVLLAGLLFAFTVGRYPVSLVELMQVLTAKLTGGQSGVSQAVESVIMQVRGPRVLAAAMVGAALAVAGTAFQGLFRNPLVSPDILGASSGAALGAVVGIFFSLGVVAIQALAFAGGLFAVLIALRWRMNVMSLPEEEARARGVSTGPLRIAIVAAATLTTSASVATAGIIGWVGLVVPHLARALVGPDFARLIPAAAILGGGYLLLIDTLARTVAEVEIPLGILTAVIGTPFFIWLLTGMQRNWS